MKIEILKKYYKPENKIERDALSKVHGRIGSYPECANCGRCVAGCELINIDYVGLIEIGE